MLEPGHAFNAPKSTKKKKKTLMEYFRRKRVLARLIKINDKFIKERKHEEKS